MRHAQIIFCTIFLLLFGQACLTPSAQRGAPNVWVVAEVLFDVLQSSKSPYEAWEPWISVGVGVGF